MTCVGCEFERPAIMEGNRDILELLMLCQRQWVVGMAGIVGLNMQVVLEMATMIGITVDRLFLHKLAVFERVALQAMRKDDGQ